MDLDLAEYLVKYGLPLIISTLSVLIIISLLMIKIIMKKNYFDYVTEKLLHLSDWETVELIKSNKKQETTSASLNDTSNNGEPEPEDQINDIVPAKSTNLLINQCEQTDEPTKTFINIQCYYIKVDPCSIFIQFPYFTRFLSYILFWGYFSIQTLCLEEVFSDTILDGYKCFNVSVKLTGKLYRY
jgi:hypothetical protein